MEEKPDKPAPESPAPALKKPFNRRAHPVLRHGAVVFFEMVAVFVLLMAVALGLFVWRLMSGPVDMGFARNYIQEALRIPEQGLTPTVGDIVLSWPDLNGPLLLGFKNAKIYNTDGKPVLAVDEAALSLSKTSLLIGKISPIALIIREPVIKVARTKTGQIVLGIEGMEAEPDTFGPYIVQEENPALEKILRYIARPGKSQHGLGTLQAFKVEGAQLVIEDKGLATAWTLPRMDASFESGTEGVKANIDIAFSTVDQNSYFKMDLDSPWDTKETQIKAEFRGLDPWFFAQRIPQLEKFSKGDVVFDGQLAGLLDANYKPKKALVELSSAGGKISDHDLSAEPIVYKDMVIHAAYDGENNKLEIADTQITAQDVTVEVAAHLEATTQKISGPVRVSIDKVTQQKVASLWPPMLEGENAQHWIVDKLSAGTFKDVYAEIQILGMNSDDGWFFGVPDVTAGFGFEGMKVDYRSPLFPVTQGKGKGTFNLKTQKLDIEISGGKIADLDIDAGKLSFTDIIEKGKGMADIALALKGPIATGMKYLSQEPIHMKTKFDPEKVKGEAKMDVRLQFPTHKDLKVKEVKITAGGILDNVFFPAVVKDLSLIGGPLAIKVEGNDLLVKGKGELGGRPVSFEYKEGVDHSQTPYKFIVQANLNSDQAIRERLGVDLNAYLEGTAPIDVTYTEYQDGHADVDVSGDLTPARLFISPFDYEKKPGVEGTVTLKAKLQEGVVKEVKGLEVSAPDLSLKKGSLGFREKEGKTVLSKGEIGDFTIGETKGSMNFTVEDSGRYKVKAVSSFFDLRPFLNRSENKKPYDNPPMLIELSADAMRGADDKKMPQGDFYIDIDGTGIYNKLVVDTGAGKGKVTLRLQPNEEGLRSFRMEADDAGAMLAAFGIYKNIRGGKMIVRGKAKEAGERNMAGNAALTDFRVVNAPTLARLISALSLPGLANLLGGEGLGFTKLEADYKWNSKAGGSVLEIKDGRTSGNSVGFSFEGKVNIGDSTIDVSGTMVPLSDINKIIKSIPLVGDILTGGSGLIAATYSVRGPADKPGVMVNPLSVLTPGILRRILFE